MAKVKELLVVEDDAAMNSILNDFLQRQGYAVDVVTSATGALRLLKNLPLNQRPNLVLSDVKLGAINGIDLCKRIGIEYPTIPVILFSVFDQLEKEALSSGAKKFLKKPFTLERLADVLKEQLNGDESVV